MAQPSSIYRVKIQLSNIDHGIYETIQASVARHPSETEERLVARLLAYALCYEEELQFTKGVGAGDEPDLWSKEPDNRIRTWLEVGVPDAERLLKAGRHAGRVILLACGAALGHWQRQQLGKLAGMANCLVLTVDQTFIATLVTGLERSINWEITITEQTLYVQVGAFTCETPLTVLVGSY